MLESTGVERVGTPQCARSSAAVRESRDMANR